MAPIIYPLWLTLPDVRRDVSIFYIIKLFYKLLLLAISLLSMTVPYASNEIILREKNSLKITKLPGFLLLNRI